MTTDLCFPLSPYLRDVFDRAVGLQVLDRAPGRWGFQIPGRTWTTARFQGLRDGDILEHLAGHRWIGSRLPVGAPLDRLIIDIDSKDPPDVDSRNDRYSRVRAAFGEDHIPLVYATPSGEGIRVAYRIPATPYEEIRGQGGGGPIHRFLAHHGLTVRKGAIEVFPDRVMLDRQMFGGSMAILCPVDLSPQIGERGRSFRPEDGELERAVQHTEQWYAREYPEIVPMILATGHTSLAPEVGPHLGTGSPKGPRRLRDATARSPSAGEHIRPLLLGLQAPSTRYVVEFVVGAALWRWPGQFPELLPGGQPTPKSVALALARWLSENHNGLSKDWLEHVDRVGEENAVDRWKEGYLRRGPGGDAPVDRMARRARSLGRGAPTSPQLTESEHRSVHLLSLHLASEFEGEVDRYQWEVWTSHFVHAVRKQVMRGGKSGDDRLSAAQLAAEWMSEWPFGCHYPRYLSLLTRKSSGGTSRPEAVEVLWRPEGWRNGMAAIYRLPWLDLGDARPPEPPPEKVLMGIGGITHHGRPMTLVEAYHAIHRTAHGPNLDRIYGASTATRIRKMDAAARNGGRITF